MREDGHFQSRPIAVHMTPVRFETVLGAAQARPADAVGRAEQSRRRVGNSMNRLLRQRQFAINKFGRFEIERRVGIGMISDFVAGRGDVAGDGVQAADVGAAHEKRRFDAVFGEQFEQRRRRFAGAVIERERQRRASAVAVIERRRQQRRRFPAHGVSRQSHRGRRREKSFLKHGRCPLAHVRRR